jgi:transposase-like protein
MGFEINTLEQFEHQFATEEACIEFFFFAKWPDGFYCTRCGHHHAYMMGTRRLPLFECSLCHYQSSLTAGTLLEGSRTDLRKWLLAIFLVSRIDQGTSAVELAKTINVTYKTAWLILRKIRFAISSADSEMPLSGIVRVNSSVYGHPHNYSYNLHPQEYPLLVGSSLNEQGHPTFLKMKLVNKSHVRDRQIRPAATLDFQHKHVSPATKDVEFITTRFNPNRFRKLLDATAQMNKWINKTFHGVGHKHLQAYLDEFCYRMNLSINKTSIFQHLASLCGSIHTITYPAITRTA